MKLGIYNYITKLFYMVVGIYSYIRNLFYVKLGICSYIRKLFYIELCIEMVWRLGFTKESSFLHEISHLQLH
jgi:hypothetical protein